METALSIAALLIAFTAVLAACAGIVLVIFIIKMLRDESKKGDTQ